MSQIQRFDNHNAKEFRNLFKEKMEEFFIETGIYVELGSNLSFTSLNITGRISGKILQSENQETAILEAAKIQWDSNAYKYGLGTDSFGKTISLNGEKFEICGIKTRKGKYGILGKNLQNGKTYGLPTFSVVRILKEMA